MGIRHSLKQISASSNDNWNVPTRETQTNLCCKLLVQLRYSRLNDLLRNYLTRLVKCLLDFLLDLDVAIVCDEGNPCRDIDVVLWILDGADVTDEAAE